MCPLFKQSLTAKFTPTSIKLSKLYQTNTGGKKLTGSSLENAREALQKAGFEESKIRDVLYHDKAISIKEMRNIANIMNKGRVYGFEKSPTTTIKNYLNKERVKAQSIASIRKEHILEASEEDLVSYGTTSLNQKGIGPNTAKAGEASILSRNKRKTDFSFSDKSRQQAKTSLSGIGKASSSLGKSSSGGIMPARPKF